MATSEFIIYDAPQRKNRIRILTGRIFGRLTVYGFAGMQGRVAMWHCLCKCGVFRAYRGHLLTSGDTHSCGCLSKEIVSSRRFIHGESVSLLNTPEYRIFNKAKERCNNPKSPTYVQYGGRGIEFRFNSYEEFLQEVGRKPTPHHSLDRIDNNGHYEKGNVRWATATEQGRNKRNNRIITAMGKSQPLATWAEETGMSMESIRHRLDKYHWCEECAVTLPKRRGRCHHRKGYETYSSEWETRRNRPTHKWRS